MSFLPPISGPFYFMLQLCKTVQLSQNLLHAPDFSQRRNREYTCVKNMKIALCAHKDQWCYSARCMHENNCNNWLQTRPLSSICKVKFCLLESLEFQQRTWPTTFNKVWINCSALRLLYIGSLEDIIILHLTCHYYYVTCTEEYQYVNVCQALSKGPRAAIYILILHLALQS